MAAPAARPCWMSGTNSCSTAACASRRGPVIWPISPNGSGGWKRIQWPLKTVSPGRVRGDDGGVVHRQARSRKPAILCRSASPARTRPTITPAQLPETVWYADIPVPQVTDEELAGQPPHHALQRRVMIDQNYGAVRWTERPSAEQLLRMRRHYAANVTLIDEQVGRILAAVGAQGLPGGRHRRLHVGPRRLPGRSATSRSGSSTTALRVPAIGMGAGASARRRRGWRLVAAHGLRADAVRAGEACPCVSTAARSLRCPWRGEQPGHGRCSANCGRRPMCAN